MTNTTTPLPLAEQVKARIAILTEIKTADRRHPNCEDCRVIIVEATARINELEQVLTMIDKTAKELEALPPYYDESEGWDCPSAFNRADALALLISQKDGKKEQ